jgi:Bacterial protein of unknown function (DUF937)
MNLVDTITNELSNGGLRQLSSLLGAGESTTRTAVQAAVPALLSGLSNVASSPGGAQKLVAALSKFDGGALDSLGQSLADRPSSVLEQGSGLLNSLLGGNMLGGITNAMSRFSGLGSGMGQKLLGYLMPMVLASMAARFTGKALNPQSLMSMFSDQKAAITNAMPSGFSLADVPGLGSVGSAAQAGARAAQTAGSSALRWLIPVGALAVIGLILLALFRPGAAPTLSVPKVTVPDFAKINSDLTGSIDGFSQSLTGIKDAASAANAVPKLHELTDKLSSMKALADKLLEVDQVKIHDMIKSNLGKLDDQFAKVLWIPGVGDKIKPQVEEAMSKLASLGDLPMPKASAVSGEVAGVISSLTNTLNGVKDAASAEAALPKLKQLNDKLVASQKSMADLPEAARSTIGSLIKTAIATVQGLANKVLASAGVGEQVRPVVDSILDKLKALAG